MKKLSFIAILVAFISPLLAHADAAKEAAAISLVKAKIELLKSNQDETINDINTKKQANAKTHGILIYDFSGKIVAWSFLPSLVGKPIGGLPNTDGTTPIKDSITQAMQGKSGWYEYSMKNPITGTEGKLKVYYEPVNNLIVTSGFFE